MAKGDDHVSIDEAARRLQICVGSVHLLIRQGVLSATQLMPSAPWKVPVAALNPEPVKIGPKLYQCAKHRRRHPINLRIRHYREHRQTDDSASHASRGG